MTWRAAATQRRVLERRGIGGGLVARAGPIIPAEGATVHAVGDDGQPACGTGVLLYATPDVAWPPVNPRIRRCEECLAATAD